MTIIEALKTGRRIGRVAWRDGWWDPHIIQFSREAVLADDWEVEPEQLKPCPFCGGKRIIDHSSLGVPIWCNDCGATCRSVEGWNRRV